VDKIVNIYHIKACKKCQNCF